MISGESMQMCTLLEHSNGYFMFRKAKLYYVELFQC